MYSSLDDTCSNVLGTPSTMTSTYRTRSRASAASTSDDLTGYGRNVTSNDESPYMYSTLDNTGSNALDSPSTVTSAYDARSRASSMSTASGLSGNRENAAIGGERRFDPVVPRRSSRQRQPPTWYRSGDWITE